MKANIKKEHIKMTISKWENSETYSQDITEREARAAYNGISFSPERRAESVLKGWPAEMVGIYKELKAAAIAGNTEHLIDAEFERFHAGYLEREKAHLHSMSNEVSTMIAGPSNFPAARQRKRAEWTHNKLTEMLDFKKRVIEIIKRKLRPDLAPIRTEDSDAVERLKEKIAEAEKMQGIMKAANKIIKKGGGGLEAALKALGLDDKTIYEVTHPQYTFQGMGGFEGFQLQNNNANIRRMKQRLEEIERKQAAPNIKEQGKDGIRFETCPGENRVRLYFPGKPAVEVISELKKNGFRWTPSLMCWQAYYNNISIMRARQFAGFE
jgi:hypothetical protein